MKQILLDSKREKFAYNQDKFVRVNLDSDQGLLPVSDISSSVDEYYQYFAEHDASKVYRLIFTINPVCSNVLFNNVSEIVYKEGSDQCAFFGESTTGGSDSWSAETSILEYNNNMRKQSMKRYNLLEDTSYSHAKIGPLVYHCGADIFNNHTLRAKEFTVVNKVEKNNQEINKDFNTISDYLRDRTGKCVKDYTFKDKKINRHQYTMNTIKTFPAAIDDNLIESNGWFGFRNPTSLNIDNITISGETFSINKCMNNNKPGEFIDMYPDRSLYSFIPKYNKYRNRLEYNWQYCLTYPYSSTTNNPLVSYGNYNGLECEIVSTKNIPLYDYVSGDTVYRNHDNQLIQFKSYVKHGLTTSSKIRIALFKDGKTTETSASIQVMAVGNGGYDAEHYFSVRLSDIMSLLNEFPGDYVTNDELQNVSFRFAKYVNGARCKYYFRLFKKIPNFNGTDVFQDDNITEEEIDTALFGKPQQFNTTLNKMAFAENIYSDKLAEIVFNDNVNTTGLKDNLGRDLSEIYLTIVKTNKGYKEWYNGNTYNTKEIEFSHCFGKITSGLDMENGKSDYNVHKLHNINKRQLNNNKYSYIPDAATPLEKEITFEDEVFYGDLVELSPYTLVETTLENVYHRFNTAQRELVSKEYQEINYDDIQSDDFDFSGETTGTNSKFKVQKIAYCVVDDGQRSSGYTYDDINDWDEDENRANYAYRGNLAPEGYYYQPHHKIQLKLYSDETQWGSNQKVTYTFDSELDGNKYHIYTSKNYYFNVNDKIILYNKETLKRLEGTITDVQGKNYTDITLKAVLESGKKLTDYMIFKINPIRPTTAYDLDDGTGRYVWRTFVPASELTPDNELYEVPFVNGAHYMYNYINFYVRRQDPYGLYGLSFSISGEGTPLPLLNLIIGGNEKDVDKFDYLENNTTTC